MAELDRLHVRVLGDVTDLHKKLSQAEKTVEQFGYNMTQVGRTLTVGLTLPLIGMGVAAGKAAIDFESSFAGIRKTMDLTEAEFARLAQANRDLAKEIPVSVNELNKIGELAGQLGIRGVDNVLKFEETIAKLAVTTDLTAEQAALSFAQIANVLQLPQDQIDRLGAAVVGLGNNFATVESKIVEFTTRIAGAGKIAGLSAGDVAGIGTAFASLGVGAEAGGTAVQKVLLAMVGAAENGGEELEKFAATAGLSVSEFTRLFRQDAAQAFTAFVEGLGRQGTAAITTLEQLGLQDQRLVRSFLAAAGAGDTLARAVAQGNQEFRDNTALTEEAAKRFATFQSQLTLTWNRLKDLAITVGEEVLPVVAKLTEGLNDLLKSTDGLSSNTLQWSIAFAAVAAALGPALLVIGRVTRAVVLLRPAIAGLSATLGLSTGGLWFVIVGITAALTYLATRFIKTKLEAAQFAAQMDAQWEQTKSGIEGATDALRELSLAQRRATVGNILGQILAAQAAHRQLVADLKAEESRKVEGKSSTGFADPGRVDELRQAVERSHQSLKGWRLAYVEAAKTLVETDEAADGLADGLGGVGDAAEDAATKVEEAATRIRSLSDVFGPALSAGEGFTSIDIPSFGDMARELTRSSEEMENLNDEATKLEVIGGHVVFAFSDALVSGLTSAKDAFKTFVDAAIRQLLRLAAQLAVFGLINLIFPGSGVALGLGRSLGFAMAGAGEANASPAGASPQKMSLSLDVSGMPPASSPLATARDKDWLAFLSMSQQELATSGG